MELGRTSFAPASSCRTTRRPRSTSSTRASAVPSAFPNGCHVAEVEIDPDTGNVEVVKYSSVNDFGTIVNPLLVEGQVHGGVVQGLGQALLENTVYDAEGQLLTGSFMDYAMPRAHHTCRYRLRQPSGAGEDQSARHQGLRRSRLRRRARLDHERDRGRAVGLWHPAYRHAGLARARVEGHSRSAGVATVMIYVLAIVLSLASTATALAQPQDGKGTEFRSYIQKLWPQAQARGVTRQTFDLAFAGIEPDPSVLALTQRQAEYGRPVGVYVSGALSPSRVAGGAQQMAKWAETFAAIYTKYGVDPVDHCRDLGHGDRIRRGARQQGYCPFAGDARGVRLSRGILPRRTSQRAADFAGRTHHARQDDRLLGRRDGPAAIHPLELRALGGGFFRRRQARHLDQCAGCAGSIANYFRQNGWTAGHALGL